MKRIKKNGRPKACAAIPDGFAQHARVTPEGARLGAWNHELYVLGERVLAAEGEQQPDCCSSCAFLRGTVPNGCAQTQLDAFKSVIEIKPFLCHMSDPGNRQVCRGWLAAVQARKYAAERGCSLPETVPYEFSPVDDQEPVNGSH